MQKRVYFHSENMNKDLTVGNVKKVLLLFCLPLFGSMFFQQLYNVADSFVAGKFLGETALAAVGNSYEITFVFLAFGFGLNIGCSVVVSRFFGAGKLQDVKTSVYTTFVMTAVTVALLMTFGLVFCKPLLRLINTPDEILADSALYLYIYAGGLPFLFFYNVSTGIFSALGDSLTPFFFLAASSLANIGMDVLFVAAFHLGVAGVAWATFLCQGVSCLLAVGAVLLRLRKMKIGKVKRFSFDIMKKITVVAVPSILQQSFISVGNIVIQGVVNVYGKSVIAGYAGATKLNNFVVSSLFTVGNGVSNFTSQNLGAGKPQRIKQGFVAGLIYMLGLAAVGGLLYSFLGQYLLRLFLDDPDGTAMATGVRFLLLVSPTYALVAIKITADGILRGAGKMGRFAVSTFTDLVLRVAGAFVLSRSLQTDGIWLSWPVGWLVGAVLSVTFCLFFFRSFKKKPEEQTVPRDEEKSNSGLPIQGE